MSTTNNQDASANDQGGTPGGGTAQNPSSAAASSSSAAAARSKASKMKEKKVKKEPTVPKLTGRYSFIKPLVETQRASLGKIMASSCKAMLDLECEIRRRIDSRARMNGTYEDQHDLDDQGKGKTKSFVPNSLRDKMPLNSSKQIKNDSRCGAEAQREITIAMAEAHRIHEQYKQDLTDVAKKIADSEIKGRINVLFHEYSTLTVKLATRFVKVAKAELNSQPEHLDETQISHIAINATFKELPTGHWDGLRFVDGCEREDIDAFYKKYQSFVGIKYDAEILPAYEEANDDACGHPDDDLIEWTRDKLLEAIPTLTTKFWKHEEEQDNAKKLDAELAELDGMEEIDDANEALDNLMDVDGEEEAVLDAHIGRRVDKAVDRRTANNKKAARKKSSGDNKTQESGPGKNGREPSNKSTNKRGKRKKKSTKHYYSSSSESDDDSYESNHRSRSRRRQHDNDHRRGRPRSILKNKGRSVSWGRSHTPDPPRSRYTRDDEPLRRHRGTTYHHSRRDTPGKRGGRGGRNKGNKNKGGGRS